jgi:SAM-dependent methyltransferase
MTQDMLDLANANRDKLGAANVEFRKGEMEAMPVDDATVDVIISNCVINLSPDKDAVFRESARVLRPGGRFHVSDVVLSREITGAEKDDLALWAGCASGALLEKDYLARLCLAGFDEVRVDSRAKIGSKPWYSATISAFKQASATTDNRQQTTEAAAGGCAPGCC